MISIVFPHHDCPENNKVLDLKLKMLQENTTCEYEVLYLVNKGNKAIVYPSWDFLIRNAKYDLVLWDNSDLVYANRWNENVLKYQNEANWICLELVECGQIGVHPNNIHKDFGITADTFRRDEFEQWVKDYSKERLGFRRDFTWYSPSVWKKSWYISIGGFDLSKEFPHPVDMEFREKAEKLGQRFITVNSFAYHFQRGHIHQGLQNERT